VTCNADQSEWLENNLHKQHPTRRKGRKGDSTQRRKDNHRTQGSINTVQRENPYKNNR
jgi:hypothetical protein